MDWVLPLLMLTVMEIVLGIDNVIFIAILVGRLPASQQPLARRLGLGLALVTRLMLLFTLSWIMGLDKQAVFELTDLGIPLSWLPEEHRTGINEITWKDIVLLLGGLFLIGKSTFEIHDKLEGAEEKPVVSAASRLGLILFQIILLDIVFSLDSVITAVGMAKRQLGVMVAAMVIAVGVMLVFAGAVSNFVHRHPTIKMLALSFLILIGVMLVADGLGQEINRGYIYFAMGFSFVVELLNLRMRASAPPVKLHEPPPVSS